MTVPERSSHSRASRPGLVLKAGAPAEREVRRLLAALLEVVVANEEGVRQDRDSELLHDFRVAVRRTRTALTQIRGVLPSRVVEPFKREFAWLGRLTGPTRDLDVFLAQKDEYEAEFPSQLRGRLQPVRRFLEARRADELRSLVDGLDSPRFRCLLADWKAILRRDEPGSDATAPRAAIDIVDVAVRDIARAHGRLLRRGKTLGETSDAGALHRVRIDGKKLRYLLEFFRSLFDMDEIRGLIGGLKRLQDALGDTNDFGVQRRVVSEFYEQSANTGIAAQHMQAMRRLIDILERKEVCARRQFAARFEDFGAQATRRRYERLLRTDTSQ